MSGDAARQRQALKLLLRPLPDDLRPAAADQRHYRLLGPLTVTRGGTPVTPSAPALQSMLGMLLVRRGNTVTRAELMEGMWAPGGRPDRADALLGTCASRLRKTLGPGVLPTLPDGYALHTSTDTVDVDQCEGLVADAEVERAVGNLRTARDHIAAALSLWRGTPWTESAARPPREPAPASSNATSHSGAPAPNSTWTWATSSAPPRTSRPSSARTRPARTSAASR